MTDRLVIGLLMALVVEACHWIRIRWEFDHHAYLRAWQFSALATVMSAVLIWMEDNHYSALPSLISWGAALLLPLQFVQSYGLRDTMDLETFSFLAKRRRMRNERHGLTGETIRFNFGNIYFLAVMMSAAVGAKADSWMFLPGLLALICWMLLASGRSHVRSLVPVLLISGGLALAGQIGLKKLADWIGRGGGDRGDQFDPNFSFTQIGTRGTVNLSPDIVWRVFPGNQAQIPPLLRTASFNFFFGTTWQNQNAASVTFSDLGSELFGEDNYHRLHDDIRAETLSKLPFFRLRGASHVKGPLPLPGNAVGLRNFEVDVIEHNPLGTVRVLPKFPVMDGNVIWDAKTSHESAPMPGDDLRVAPSERDAVRVTVNQLRLKDAADLQQKLNILRTWFHREFRYTRELTIRQPSTRDRLGDHKAPTALAQFLTEVRAGHCEYFATAATLILREAGVRARYTIGYAVIEGDPDRGGYVIRGTHAHAWCRVWDDTKNQWLDFDPTPPDWSATVSRPQSLTQRFNDFVLRAREDFFIWRNQPANQLKVSVVMSVIGLIFIVTIVRRLMRSKRQLHEGVAAGASRYYGPVVRTPLHALEAPARKHLGPRPLGQPFADWLMRLRPVLEDSLILDEAIELHQQLRFDPLPPALDRRDRLESLTRQLESVLKRG